MINEYSFYLFIYYVINIFFSNYLLITIHFVNSKNIIYLFINFILIFFYFFIKYYNQL